MACPAGLRFPIPSFFAQLSRLYKIPLNQLTPTSIRKAVFFHMIFSLEGVEDTATFFYRSHELKHRGYYLYFSPLIWFASFYGHYDSLDSGWHPQYLVASPPPGRSWDIANISILALLSRDKPSYTFPKLSTEEDNVLSDLRIDYPEDHTMLRPLV